MFEDQIELDNTEDSGSSDDDEDGIDLEGELFDDEISDGEADFDFQIPKNSVCSAHMLQLALKDVFETNQEMLGIKKVSFFI